MISAWIPGPKGLIRHDAVVEEVIPIDTVWLDLVDITKAEESLVERFLGFEIPTRAEMQEIEASSRLYKEGRAVVMTATMLIKTETESPETSAVTFMLTPERLVTLRYAEPWSFRIYAQRAAKNGAMSAEATFAAIMDTTVERLADMLELVTVELDHVSHQVFRRHHPSRTEQVNLDLQKAIIKLGTCGNICSKVRESLIDKNRLMIFAVQAAGDFLSNDAKSHLKAIQYDAQTLSDHASFMSSKIQFLLDATLGLINIEQNRIIKLFSIAAVIFMPPTLIASIFGMNYHLWPANEWDYGFIYSVGLMVISVASTLWFFRRRHWM